MVAVWSPEHDILNITNSVNGSVIQHLNASTEVCFPKEKI